MNRILKQGSSGPQVKAVQDVLNFHIRRLGPLKVDGIFGPKTRARVIEFQRVNKLKPDGIVGPLTNAQLFEVTELPLPIVFIPQLTLSQPQLGARNRDFGIQTPRLIPPLQWPGPPFTPPVPFLNLQSFTLLENSSTFLPSISDPASALGLTVTMPTRKDPADPFVASRLAIIDLIDDLPVNSKFKVFLISKVPNPITKISPPPTGFDWGASPIFDPFNPTGFGVKGNAQFMIRVTDGGNGLPNMVFGAWGDGKFFLNFETKQGEARPAVQANGQMFLGVQGVF
ncbi:MAG TPA: peptidoglycan-binding domain-containing protein [Pyrinomonadaceae bacterium]|nr:peptidoglycan-binding domain-containing protein [Pyrinomonadaceae bacterium]